MTGQSGRGRPTTGVRVDVRIPADLLAQVDTFAAVNGLTRAVALREIVAMWCDRVSG